MVSHEKSTVVQTALSPSNEFFSDHFPIFPLYLPFRSLIMMYLDTGLLRFILCEFLSSSWICWCLCLDNLGSFQSLFLPVLFSPSLLLLFLGNKITHILDFCYHPTGPWGFVLFFFQATFSLMCLLVSFVCLFLICFTFRFMDPPLSILMLTPPYPTVLFLLLYYSVFKFWFSFLCICISWLLLSLFHCLQCVYNCSLEPVYQGCSPSLISSLEHLCPLVAVLIQLQVVPILGLTSEFPSEAETLLCSIWDRLSCEPASAAEQVYWSWLLFLLTLGRAGAGGAPCSQPPSLQVSGGRHAGKGCPLDLPRLPLRAGCFVTLDANGVPSQDGG